MPALELVETWPVPNAAAVTVAADGRVLGEFGDVERPFMLASLTKMLTAWAVLVATEEGLLALDDPVGQPGCTLRHLLAHAGGYSFDGPDPITSPNRRRIYSNTGIEVAAGAVVERSGMAFDEYLGGAVLQPLEMSRSELVGSPAHGLRSTAGDIGRFLAELQRPTLLSEAPPPTRFGRSFRRSPVSCPAWGASIRAHGGWGSRSGDRSRHTGRAAPTRLRRTDTSAAPERWLGSIRTLAVRWSR